MIVIKQMLWLFKEAFMLMYLNFKAFIWYFLSLWLCLMLCDALNHYFIGFSVKVLGESPLPVSFVYPASLSITLLFNCSILMNMIDEKDLELGDCHWFSGAWQAVVYYAFVVFSLFTLNAFSVPDPSFELSGLYKTGVVLNLTVIVWFGFMSIWFYGKFRDDIRDKIEHDNSEQGRAEKLKNQMIKHGGQKSVDELIKLYSSAQILDQQKIRLLTDNSGLNDSLFNSGFDHFKKQINYLSKTLSPFKFRYLKGRIYWVLQNLNTLKPST